MLVSWVLWWVGCVGSGTDRCRVSLTISTSEKKGVSGSKEIPLGKQSPLLSQYASRDIPSGKKRGLTWDAGIFTSWSRILIINNVWRQLGMTETLCLWQDGVICNPLLLPTVLWKALVQSHKHLFALVKVGAISPPPSGHRLCSPRPPLVLCFQGCCFVFFSSFVLPLQENESEHLRKREKGRKRVRAPKDLRAIKEGYLCVCQQDEINESKKKKKKDSSQRQSNMYLIKANIKIKVTCWINKQHFFLHAFWTRQIRILHDEDIMCHNN